MRAGNFSRAHSFPRLSFTAPVIAGKHSQQHADEQTEYGP